MKEYLREEKLVQNRYDDLVENAISNMKKDVEYYDRMYHKEHSKIKMSDIKGIRIRALSVAAFDAKSLSWHFSTRDDFHNAKIYAKVYNRVYNEIFESGTDYDSILFLQLTQASEN